MNRTSLSDYSARLARQLRKPYSDFLLKRALQESWSHFVTLNFHRAWDAREANRALSKWAHSMDYHMFRRQAARPSPPHRALYFFAFKEFTGRDDPHWHLLLNVAGAGSARLAGLGHRKWRGIVQSGTSDVQPIGDTAADHERVCAYATKCAHHDRSLDDFCTSLDFGLPSYCNPAPSSCEVDE